MQMLEKWCEYSVDLHMLFADFRQALDSMRRATLYETTRDVGIPLKPIKLGKVKCTKAKVKYETMLSESFACNMGVKQDGGLSYT